MNYYALDVNTVIDYVKNRPALKEHFPTNATLIAKEVGDGNLNLVFFVENADDPTNSIVVKQALPYLRVMGESWPLTRERVRYETQALRKHQEVASGLSPAVYDYDDEMSTLSMEHLREHEIMRKPLVERKRFPLFADHISTFLANSLFYTSDLYLTGAEKKKMQELFTNEQLRKLQEDVVYTNPYMDAEENDWNPLVDDAAQAVRANAELKMAIADAKRAYTTHAEALIHADLHTGSIMLNTEDTRVIDPEFAFFCNGQ
ncbi:MAG: S-methyl-5-thioribose kinase [Chloroflexota bacterium]